jgi:hypothetical protein
MIFSFAVSGIPESIPILGLSIAAVQNTEMNFHTIEELSIDVARLKKRCKSFRRGVYPTIEEKGCCQV